MSLSDLKKNHASTAKKKTFTVDEFIDDAENYAQGSPEIVSGDKNHSMTLEEAINAAKEIDQAKRSTESGNHTNNSAKPYRHATFTLSEEAITQLNAIATESKLAKSHIIRILILEFCNTEQKEKLSHLLDSNIS